MLNSVLYLFFFFFLESVHQFQKDRAGVPMRWLSSKRWHTLKSHEYGDSKGSSQKTKTSSQLYRRYRV